MSSESARRRIQATINHLEAGRAPEAHGEVEAAETRASYLASSGSLPFEQKHVDVESLQKFLDGKTAGVQNRVRKAISTLPELANPMPGLNPSDMKEKTLEWVKFIASTGLIRLRDLVENPSAFYGALEALAWFNVNAVIKLAVQYSLWGGTIMNLGTARHHKFIDDIESVKLPGCFAMTEIGHGSNVRGVETTATYDPKTKEFVVNSPSKSAYKYWLGNAARHALMGTVFVRLIVGGKDRGVHTIVVPMRDAKDMSLLPGIDILDCGWKMGLNGVDNGGIGYNNVRVPRENLLNKYADVTADGRYTCKLRSEGAHFGAVMNTLTGGRVLIAATGLTVTKLALAIAIRYGAVRTQFGPRGGAEVPILNFTTHQTRLMPRLARTYAMQAVKEHLFELYDNRSPATGALIHAFSSGVKSVLTWNQVTTCQLARECCGGMGFRWLSRLPDLKGDGDVWVTFEGDNTVLMQQVSKFLLSQYKKQVARNRKTGASFSGALAYLNTTRSDDDVVPGCVTDPTVQDSIFKARERQRLFALISALQAAGKKTKCAFTSWNEVLPEAMALAWAHMDRVTHEVFTAYIQKAPVGTRDVLRVLLRLNGVFQIDADAAFIAGSGLMAAKEAKALESKMVALCRQVTPYALGLVDAWGIPKNCLPQVDLRGDC